MKWDEYKKLSREKREEYDFKFGDIDYPRTSISYVVTLYLKGF